MVFYFLLTLILYSLYASVPFWGLHPKLYIWVMPLFSLAGGIIWAKIAMKTNKSDLTVNGLIFDALISASFFIVPALLIKQDFTFMKIQGIILIILGIILIKSGA